MGYNFADVCTVILVLFVVVCNTVDIEQLDTAVRRKAPGLKSPKKAWWAKEITPEFHVAGRLSERDIKYASEVGFKSIVSLFTYEEDEAGDFGGEYMPTSAEAWHYSHLSGMQYMAVLGPWDDWASVETVKRVAEILERMRRPVLLHCDRGYTITFVILMHMANLTRHNPEYTPRISSEKFYSISAAMGLEFTMDFTKHVVSEITGEPVFENPPGPDASPNEWLDYWVAHPVYKNWYTAGQIRRTHLPIIQAAGFNSVVNMRRGMTTDGQPTQEMVTLLNIKDGTPTYGDGIGGGRQTEETLLTLRLDDNKDSCFIAEDAHVNYESRNPTEFGDDIGYNEELERQAFVGSPITYYHMPVDSDGLFSSELFLKYKDTLLHIGKQGPVLVHCASGKRVAFMAVLAAALQYGMDLNWALRRTQELGFNVGPDNHRDVYEMYCFCLQDNIQQNFTKEEL